MDSRNRKVNNENNRNEENIITNDLAHMHSVRKYSSMWGSKQTYEEHFNTLNGMNLIGFSEHFRVGCGDPLKNKTCLNVKRILSLFRAVGIFKPQRKEKPWKQHHDNKC